ncbi:MAG: 50S ribosomal protein L6 [Acidobacteria bacterium]|nr:50S ribosomal protein L6 [Acidobacteriota bacterium]
MSRIGKKIIKLPKGVAASLLSETLELKGPKGTLQTPVPPGIRCLIEVETLRFERAEEGSPALHGLARALAANAVVGVSDGFQRELDIVGVGYKVDVQPHRATFNLGYSHAIDFPIPEGISIKAERKPKQIPQYQMSLTVAGTDKQLVGQVAANIRRLRQPDAYKGKGVRYAEERLKLKPGKTGK